ncbi:hypothetical protein KWH09_22865 [Xanthomonas campestris pv. olitorii]
MRKPHGSRATTAGRLLACSRCRFLHKACACLPLFAECEAFDAEVIAPRAPPSRIHMMHNFRSPIRIALLSTLAAIGTHDDCVPALPPMQERVHVQHQESV